MYVISLNKTNRLTLIKALCNYFNNGDVPIAAIRPVTNQTFFDDYEYT